MSIYYMTPINRITAVGTTYYKGKKNNRKQKPRKQYACYSNVCLINFRNSFSKQLKKAKKLSCDLTVSSLNRKLNVIDEILTSRKYYG